MSIFKNFAKFTGKHLCWSSFFDKVAGCVLAQVSLYVNFAKFLRTPFYRTPQVNCFCYQLVITIVIYK